MQKYKQLRSLFSSMPVTG